MAIDGPVVLVVTSLARRSCSQRKRKPLVRFFPGGLERGSSGKVRGGSLKILRFAGDLRELLIGAGNHANQDCCWKYWSRVLVISLDLPMICTNTCVSFRAAAVTAPWTQNMPILSAAESAM